MNVEEKILNQIDWLRLKGSPVRFYYLENNIIVKFEEKINKGINNEIKYEIYDNNGNETNKELYKTFEECLLAIALKKYKCGKNGKNIC